jgi:hypothetical protein
MSATLDLTTQIDYVAPLSEKMKSKSKNDLYQRFLVDNSLASPSNGTIVIII